MSTLVKIPAGGRIILGSRSARRRDLLGLLVPADQIVVVPPDASTELNFDGIRDWPGIEARLEKIVREKSDDVRDQLSSRNLPSDLADIIGIVCADTVIVIQASGSQEFEVRGQPSVERWKSEVAEWFDGYCSGRPHWVLSGVSVTTIRGGREFRIVKTEVTFSPESRPFIENYIETEEPLGKAGGYGLQAGGSLFVESIVGSSSNVIGLPLRETAELILKTLDKRT
ncbi:MAG TPA: Maf family protein [Planctomycetaceae bacterium]|nr:Maf family protein [Planctomycetaceae bacterium]